MNAADDTRVGGDMNQLVEQSRERGWGDCMVLHPVAGPVNEFCIEVSYPDLGTYEQVLH